MIQRIHKGLTMHISKYDTLYYIYVQVTIHMVCHIIQYNYILDYTYIMKLILCHDHVDTASYI